MVRTIKGKSNRKQTFRGVPPKDARWGKLFDFMDENEFTVQDFLACVCANLLGYTTPTYFTKLGVGRQTFSIAITKGEMTNELYH